MKKLLVFLCILCIAVVVVIAVPFIGIERIPYSSLLGYGSGDVRADILWKIRIPRVLTAFCAGSALAISGMTFQALFRNPLATPFTLGVSSGAAFGAVLSIRMGLIFTIFGLSSQSLFSFVGAVISIGVVYGLSRIKKGFSTATMLLSGVAVSFFFSSLILFFQYMSDFTQSFRIIRWLMGGIEVIGFHSIMTMLPFVVIGSIVIVLLSRELNLIAIGEDVAISKGVNVKAIKTGLFVVISLMVGGVVSQCGPIGFIGMISPHICRIFIGHNHRYLMPTTLLFGGLFLTICDTLARTIIAPVEIPVGVITALLGGPFFIWLLLRGTSEERTW